MCTAIVSVLTGIPVRADVAMTGEITLRGQVLPIGGLKEKLLAAQRGGVKNVIIPMENERDLKEIPDNVKENLKIYPLKWMDEVLEIALERTPKPKIASEVTMAGSDPATAVAKVSEKVAEVAPKRSQTEGDLPISPH
jgi:ATP-dependent Lon protease